MVGGDEVERPKPAPDGVLRAARELLAAAVAQGVFGIPSFEVGDELFFGKDSLGDLEAELRS